MLLSACEPVTEVMGLLQSMSKNLFGSYLMINVFPCIITHGRTGYGTVCIHVHVCECGHGFHCEIIYVL